MEGELEMVWQTAQSENRRLKEAFLDIKSRQIESNYAKESYHMRLLLDD